MRGMRSAVASLCLLFGAPPSPPHGKARGRQVLVWAHPSMTRARLRPTPRPLALPPDRPAASLAGGAAPPGASSCGAGVSAPADGQTRLLRRALLLLLLLLGSSEGECQPSPPCMCQSSPPCMCQSAPSIPSRGALRRPTAGRLVVEGDDLADAADNPRAPTEVGAGCGPHVPVAPLLFLIWGLHSWGSPPQSLSATGR